MAKEWCENCNRKAYGQDGSFIDNREKVEFKSGRTIYYKKNSRARKSHSLKFAFDDMKKIDGKTEFEWFLWWFDTEIAGGAEPFTFDDITTRNGSRNYHISEPPTWIGQRIKEVSVVFEEE